MFRLQERMLGRPSFAILGELRRSQFWSHERLRDLQLHRLGALLATAWEHAPFWRERMEQAGVAPTDFRSIEDIRRLPLLEKADLRAHRERMVWPGEGRRVSLVRTSGSTNEALQFYTSSTREAHINAARMRGHEWVGVRRGEKEMYFWGSPVELSSQDRLKRFRDRLINDGLANGFELSPERARRYFEQWKRWRPRCIFGYPCSFSLMVDMAEGMGLDLSELARRGLKVIVTTSEMLTDCDRERIAAAFAVPVYDSYGLREGGLVGHECAEGTMHCVDEQVLLETVDPETLEPTDGEGELVLTNLVSQVMPVIRYRTGDIVTLWEEPCTCGLSLGSVRISGGRVADFVVTTDGRWIPGYAFIYICRSVPGVVKFQARQDGPGLVRVALAVDEKFPADGCERVRRAALERLRSDDRVEVTVADDIRPAPSGKYRPVIGKLAEELRSSGNRQSATGDG
jgi:phenylacetate-CoA ligase